MDSDLWTLAFKMILLGLVALGVLILGLGVVIGVAL